MTDVLVPRDQVAGIVSATEKATVRRTQKKSDCQASRENDSEPKGRRKHSTGRIKRKKRRRKSTETPNFGCERGCTAQCHQCGNKKEGPRVKEKGGWSEVGFCANEMRGC